MTRDILQWSFGNGNVDIIVFIKAVFDASTAKTLNPLLKGELETFRRITIPTPSFMHDGLFCGNESLLDVSGRFALTLNPG